MPFTAQIEDDEILDQFDRDANGRSLFSSTRTFYTAAELSEGLDVTSEAVRQRLNKMKGDEVETDKIAGTTVYKLKTDETPVSAMMFGTREIFPAIPHMPGRVGIGVYSALLTVLVTMVFSGLTGTPYTAEVFAIMLLVGSALGYVGFYGSSLLIGVFQKFAAGR